MAPNSDVIVILVKSYSTHSTYLASYKPGKSCWCSDRVALQLLLLLDARFWTSDLLLPAATAAANVRGRGRGRGRGLLASFQRKKGRRKVFWQSTILMAKNSAGNWRYLQTGWRHRLLSWNGIFDQLAFLLIARKLLATLVESFKLGQASYKYFFRIDNVSKLHLFADTCQYFLS